MRRRLQLLACCTSLVAGAVARAEEEWQQRFEQACGKTQDAMALSNDDLRALIASCDGLKPEIAALDESRRKVYGKRLQLCRDLYDYVLRSREPR